MKLFRPALHLALGAQLLATAVPDSRAAELGTEQPSMPAQAAGQQHERQRINEQVDDLQQRVESLEIWRTGCWSVCA